MNTENTKRGQCICYHGILSELEDVEMLQAVVVEWRQNGGVEGLCSLFHVRSLGWKSGNR